MAHAWRLPLDRVTGPLLWHSTWIHLKSKLSSSLHFYIHFWIMTYCLRTQRLQNATPLTNITHLCLLSFFSPVFLFLSSLSLSLSLERNFPLIFYFVTYFLGGRIVEISTTALVGMTISSLGNYYDQHGGKMYSRNVTWTPTSSAIGQHIFCFKAIDKNG